MSVTRLILLCLMFFFIYRLIKSFIASFRSGYNNQKANRTYHNVKSNPKYTDIEEAKYVEIMSEGKPKQESVEKEK